VELTGGRQIIDGEDRGRLHQASVTEIARSEEDQIVEDQDVDLSLIESHHEALNHTESHHVLSLIESHHVLSLIESHHVLSLIESRHVLNLIESHHVHQSLTVDQSLIVEDVQRWHDLGMITL